ncbi:MAG: flavodoxin family protein [Candidatus Omnitrophica bacterium]|nr:flavodoxin family protein [Candidatus Omnitrophota bacterium]
MKVLGICGSPRKGGNTDILLDKALEGAEEAGAQTEKLFLNDLKISPTQESEYDNIDDKGFSVIADDIQIVFKKIQESDRIIIASPVFFGSVSAQVKTMIDRFQCVWVAKNIDKKEVFSKGKIGGFISVQAAGREDFFNNSKEIIKHFFATIGIEYRDDIFCHNVEEKGEVLDHPEYLAKAFEMGKEMAGS